VTALPSKWSMAKPLLRVVIAALVCVLVVACGDDDDSSGGSSSGSGGEAELKDVSVRFEWFPYGGHSGYVVAKDKGWYEDAGLNVEFQYGQGSTEVVQQVAAGKSTFGHIAAGFAVVAGRAEGTPVKAVANIASDAGFCVLVRADSGIDSADDLARKTVGSIPGSPVNPLLPAMVDNGGADGESMKVQEMAATAGVPALVRKRIDGWLAVAFSDLTYLKLDFNTEPGCINFKDYDLGLMGPSIVAAEDTIENDPEMVDAFVDATMRGFRDALANPKDAATALENQAGDVEGAVTPEAMEISQADLKEYIPSEANEGQPYGYAAEEDWQSTIDIMSQYLDFKDEVAASDMFTNEFVEDGEPLN
jgi:NitT/TauT family transport system substrate-binding protein